MTFETASNFLQNYFHNRLMTVSHLCFVIFALLVKSCLKVTVQFLHRSFISTAKYVTTSENDLCSSSEILRQKNRMCDNARPPTAKAFIKDARMRYFCCQEERSRTGRYVAGGTALAVMLLALHHLLLRGASTIAGVCIPAIIMASYIIWVLYSARRDRRKVTGFELLRCFSCSLLYRSPRRACT